MVSSTAGGRRRPTIRQVIGARMGSAWSLLCGRATYEDLYGYWPKPPPNPMTDALDRVKKFVASAALKEPPPWQHSKLLPGDAAAAIGELRHKHDKTLVIFGSGVLVQSLLQHGLIDEFVLPIHPLVLGQGQCLSRAGGAPAKFELFDGTSTKTGVVMATWKLAS